MITRTDALLSAPPVAVAGARVFFGLTLPEWAAVVTIIYTVALLLRMAWHEYREWKRDQP